MTARTPSAELRQDRRSLSLQIIREVADILRGMAFLLPIFGLLGLIALWFTGQINYMLSPSEQLGIFVCSLFLFGLGVILAFLSRASKQAITYLTLLADDTTELHRRVKALEDKAENQNDA